MTPSSRQPSGWSGRQFGLAVLALAAVHVWIISMAVSRPVASHTSHLDGFVLRWTEWKGGPGAVAAELGVDDPRLFAAPDESSLNKPTWHRVGEPAAPGSGWGTEQGWLDLRTNWLRGMTGVGWTSDWRARIAELRVPPEMSQVDVPPLTLPSRSMLELDSALASRGLVQSSELPTLTHTNLLERPVEVQVLVDGRGWVFSAVILQGCGWRPADERALQAVEALRFQPLPDSTARSAMDRPQWGRIRVRWQVKEGPSKPPPPGRPS